MSPPPASSDRSNDRIVAVGLLTQRDVDILGTGFRRLFPVEGVGAFDDLLKQLDALDVPIRPPNPQR